MHFCTAMVQIAGDKDQIVFKDKFSPVSWPEAELLRVIHGEDAVLELKPFVHVNQTPREERLRLILKYGKEYVDECFPGRGGNIIVDAPEADIAYGQTWKNPLTQLEETIEGALEPEASKSRGAGGKFAKTEATL